MTHAQPARPLTPIDSPGFIDALLSSISEGVVICDSNGKLLPFNRAALRFHLMDETLSPDELAKKLDSVQSWAKAFGLCRLDKTPLPENEVPLRKVLDSKSGTPVLNYEMLIRHSDGAYLRIVASAAQISKDGNVCGAVATMRDITQLSDVERRLSQLLGNVPGMAYRRRIEQPWIVDVLSEGSLELTGYTRNELQGAESPVKWGSLIHPDDVKRYTEETKQNPTSDRQFTVIYRIIRRDLSTRWIWERGRVLRDSAPGGDAVESYLMDYEDRKKLEEDLKQKYDAAKSEADRRNQDNRLRLALTWGLIIQFLLANLTVLVLMILQWAKAGLSETTLLGFFGGTVAELAGIVIIVSRYLFPSVVRGETDGASGPSKAPVRSADENPRPSTTS